MVREWIGSVDEGPVMVDSVIMRRERGRGRGGEREGAQLRSGRRSGACARLS